MIVDLVRKAREIGVKCTERDELRGFAPIGAKPLSSIPPSSLFRGCGCGSWPKRRALPGLYLLPLGRHPHLP